MLKTLRRLLTATIAGASITPVSRAVIPPTEQIETEADAALKAVDYEHLTTVRSEYLKNYTGPKIGVDEAFIWSGKTLTLKGDWRNLAMNRAALQAEVEAFVQARTR